MAQRRMFSLKIIDTDHFLDMSLTARLLYYDLAMRADDEGFVASPKKITKMVGCSEDDLKLLIAKQFIIPFESGVCVIKDWKIHNYIRSDRKQATQYSQEKQLLKEDKNGSYIKCLPHGIPNDNQMSGSCHAQDRLGKVRLGEDSLEKGKDSLKNNNVNGTLQSKDSDIKNNSSFSVEDDNITDPDLFLPFDTFPLDNCSCAFNDDYSFDVDEVSTYFAATYKKHRGEEHPRYSLDQLKKCFNCLEEFEPCTDTAIDLIDDYFETELECDYRFAHFCTPGILRNRLYETGHTG